MGIHRDDRSVFPLQLLFSSNLQIDIDGELEWLSRDRLGLAETSYFAPMAINQCLTGPVLPHQQRVVLAFDSGYPNNITWVIQLKLGLVEHVLGDFAHISDQMSHEAVSRIEAPVRHDRVEFRQLIAMSFDELQLVRRDVLF